MLGKARMGSMVMGLSVGKVSMRVMHMSLGMPLISAEQEPHLPALQFQRQARSGACVAWIWWTASRTTMPSPTSARSSCNLPPSDSPRQIRNIAWCMTVSLLGQEFEPQRHREDNDREREKNSLLVSFAA